jgi:hypothetical protein
VRHSMELSDVKSTIGFERFAGFQVYPL